MRSPRTSRSLRVVLGALCALGLLRCGSFTGSEQPPIGDATSESSPRVDAPADAPSEANAYLRTGVICGSKRARCAVGESCCGTGQGEPSCAVDCADAGATFYIFECGQTSDCREGNECCGSQNGTSLCDGRLAGASCVPAGNCRVCGETDGGAARLCDPSSNAECRGRTCTLHFDQSNYTACAL